MADDDIEILPPEAEQIWPYELLERVCIQAEPGSGMTLDDAFRANGVTNWRERVELLRRADVCRQTATTPKRDVGTPVALSHLRV